MVPQPESDEQLIAQTDPFTSQYPDKVCSRATLRLKSGEELVSERAEYPGFLSCPLTWDQARQKFMRLASITTEEVLADEITSAIKSLEDIKARELVEMLAKTGSLAQGKAQLI